MIADAEAGTRQGARRRRAAVAAAPALLWCAAGRAEYVVALGGVEFEGVLCGLDSNNIATAVTVGGSRRDLPLEDIVSVAFGGVPVPAETVLPGEFLFANGDRLRAAVVSAAAVPANLDDLGKALEGAQQVTVRSALAGALRIRTDQLYGFVHHTRAAELGKQDGFLEREAALRKRDWVWLANGDVQSGIIEGFLRNDRGKFDLFYTSEGKRYRVDLFGVAAARFQQLVSADRVIPSGVAAVVRLVDGSVLSGPLLEFTRTAIRIRTIGGDEVEIAKSAALTMTVRNGRTVFLSPAMPQTAPDGSGGQVVVRELGPLDHLDLTPVAMTNAPFLSRAFTPRKDGSYGGNALTLGNRTFTRGIGTHSRSELVYRLDGRFERFEAVIGIDAEVGRRGDAVFRVVADGRDVLPDGRARGGDAWRSVRIPVTGVRELRLVVECGEDLDMADHADWAEACVIRPARGGPGL
jgi:hypothetical protein